MTGTPAASVRAPLRVERSAFWPLTSLRIIVDPAPEPEMTAEQQSRWNALRARNPALFDGPIYSVIGGLALPGDAAGGQAPARGDASPAPKPARRSIGHKPDATLHCRRSRYHEILLRRPTDEGLLLSVTALLTCAGHVLLGQRGTKLRSYPGMWEIGPAGGLDPASGIALPGDAPAGPPSDRPAASAAPLTASRNIGQKPDATELGLAEIHTALRAEVREEVGLEIDASSARLIGACADEAARSLDLVLALELPPPLPMLRHGDGWEYQDAGWAPILELPAIVRQRRFIPPSLAIMAALGWIDQPPPPPPPPPPAGAGSS